MPCRARALTPEIGSSDPRVEEVARALMAEAPPSPEDSELARERHELVIRALMTLPRQEREVILWRFGIGGYDELSLKETGKMVGRATGGGGYVGLERVRQIEARALRKLRHPARAQYLREVHI